MALIESLQTINAYERIDFKKPPDLIVCGSSLAFHFLTHWNNQEELKWEISKKKKHHYSQLREHKLAELIPHEILLT